MTARIYAFSPRVGGGYRMAFLYPEGVEERGKTTQNADIFEGRFVELLADQKIVEAVTFQSDNPDYAGTITLVTTLTPLAAGTQVILEATNVPSGINGSDHREGMESSLKNLARLLE